MVVAWALTALLSLVVVPRVCTAPCDGEIRVRVVPTAANRWVVVELDSDNYYRSTMVQLDGDMAPPSLPPIPIRRLPAGKYTVRVVLYQQGDNEVERTTTTLTVIGIEHNGYKRR